MSQPYAYQGTCPQSGRLLRLERTAEAVVAARGLMAELPDLEEGKMFGVLVTVEGTVLRAFSGLQERTGWSPPIYTHGHSDVPQQLDQLKVEIQTLGKNPAGERLQHLEKVWEARLSEFQTQCRQAKERRDSLRGQGHDPAELVLESQREGTAAKKLRAQRNAEIAPLRAEVAEVQAQILQRKRLRRELSAGLQREMHQGLSESLSAGQAWSLASLFPAGPPTGTGECCAPKLLVQAARLGLTPTGLAEFWWGPTLGNRRQGEFYTACKERCQPLIGPLLARLEPLTVLYRDQNLLAVVKPPGVLTLPGRQGWNQDCLWRRLQRDYPEALPIHRLDLETSGVCLWALDPTTQRELQRQFAERSVQKTYEALLSRVPASSGGCLDLPLAADPDQPGRYRVDPSGKASQTEFQQLEGVRYQFRPLTGRSHQIRVHAAQGLKAPIQGDRLYGGGEGSLRLHARALHILHCGKALQLEAATPF